MATTHTMQYCEWDCVDVQTEPCSASADIRDTHPLSTRLRRFVHTVSIDKSTLI